jgi:hypothetical protein
MIEVRLGYDEIEVLHRLAGTALLSKQLPEDEPALRSALKKLTKAALKVLCHHCRVRPRRGRATLCSRCNLYLRVNGHLPSMETLIKSGAPRPRQPRKSLH